MKKKVFHIIPELEVGGTEKQLLLLLPELQKTVDNEVVCLMGQGPIGEALHAKGIPVHYLNGRSNMDFLIPLRLWRLLRRSQPDAVITYLIYADIVGRFMARLAKIQVVIASHRSHLFGPAWWHKIDRITRRLVSHYTTQTQTTKDLLCRVLKLPADKITVIPNAVETSLSDPAPLSDALTITCVANLKPEKRIDLLLAVFEKLYETHKNICLWLVGEGPEAKSLKQLCSSYKSRPRIYFLGLRSDVSDILSKTDIFVLPSRTEGMSNALLEAMAEGLPCVAANLPVNKKLVTNNQNGLLFRTNDESSLYEQLQYLVVHPEKRRALGEAAKKYTVANHSVAVIAARWAQLINQL